MAWAYASLAATYAFQVLTSVALLIWSLKDCEALLAAGHGVSSQKKNAAYEVVEQGL